MMIGVTLTKTEAAEEPEGDLFISDRRRRKLNFMSLSSPIYLAKFTLNIFSLFYREVLPSNLTIVTKLLCCSIFRFEAFGDATKH